jgi:peptide/nickel transport system ATP-binding protein
VRNLAVEFVDRGTVTNRPLRGIDLEIQPGEILGVVGESGCGKSLTGLAILGLLPKGARVSGDIIFSDDPADAAAPGVVQRGDTVSLVFQNPGTAFNPVFTIGSQMLDVVKRHRGTKGRSAAARIHHYLELAGLPDPARVANSYPHELSGGMLQRSMIAMALLCEPRLLILDEPTTALDATVAQHVLRLILELRDTLGFGVLLITHNVGVVRDVCDRVAVLYAGRVVETGPTEIVLDSPQHPYTRGLLGALPGRHRTEAMLEAIPGTVPSNLLGLVGCSFANRCTFVTDLCRTTDPTLVLVAPQHESDCLRSAEL